MPAAEIFSRLYDSITKGNIKESLEIYNNYIKELDGQSFQEMFKQVLLKIKEDYENEKNSNATYHVSQKISETLKKMISKN